MLKIAESINLKCKNCNKVYSLAVSKFQDFTQSTFVRSMGNEIEYIWNYDFYCENCNNHIEVNISGYEYPIGFFNYQDSECIGCYLSNEPKIISKDEQ